jgi:hypothetical protein
MHRRTLLAGWGTVLAGVLAGCGGDGDGGNGEADGGSTPADTETEAPTDTPMETATPAETETPTETATPESADEFTHEIGEEFTVGEGDNPVTYRILELARSDQVGSQANYTTADGTFLIVTLEVANPQDEEIEFPRRDFRLQDENRSWQRFDRGPTEKVGSDGRLDVESIGDDTFTPGDSKIGAVVFDVDPDLTYRLWITPAGEADTPEHFVPIPDISSVEELGQY